MPCIYKQAQAKQDLVDIWLYTFGQWGETQADNYLDKLEAAFLLLAEQPMIARERTEFVPPVRIYHYANHLIVYLVVDGGINIVRVLHKNMDIYAQLGDS